MTSSAGLHNQPEGNPASLPTPWSLVNIRLFVAFRVLFNARFYYPVFTILFLDFGLTLSQFALLNTLWAATIVLAEVPSGALADVLGRKRLLVIATLLMTLEMALIAFVPLGNMQVVFAVFCANRILSGLAEAFASGADEALAYDTLVEHGMAGAWPRVLEMQMRAQNLGFLFAMTMGAAVYDQAMVNRLLAGLGIACEVSQKVSMRYPVYLTLFFALVAVVATFRMHDSLARPVHTNLGQALAVMRATGRLTWRAGSWIGRTPFALTVILLAMTLDHVLRMLVTLTSEYYRLIGLPEASFGLIGSAVAVVGLFVPRLGRWMVERFSPAKNVGFLSIGAMLAVYALTLFVPYAGIIPMVAVFVGLMLTSFFTSHYLNSVTPSNQRATVLSFKGLALNAAYGIIGLAFASAIRLCKQDLAVAHGHSPASQIENMAFAAVVGWFPRYLAVALLLAVLLVHLRLKFNNAAHPTSNSPAIRHAQFFQDQGERTEFGETELEQVGADKGGEKKPIATDEQQVASKVNPEK